MPLLSSLSDALVPYAQQITLMLMPATLQLTIIFITCLLLQALVRRGFKSLTAKVTKKNALLVETLASLVRLLIMVAGLIMALSSIGIDVSALVAGLGLSGFALGFAFKDILSNILSGLLIIFYSPFKAGQKIKVDSFEGKVTGIDLRYVTLQNEDNQVILVPNTLALTKVVVVTPKEKEK